jgi:predicted  nucleic acid-binding Zn-ribbon protein
MTRTVTQEDFLNRCVSKHGDRYDYTQTVYSSGKAKVDIICKKHGIFSQLPSVHSLGSGCPKCGRESSESSKVKYDEVSFREKVSHIWGELDFTKTKYVHPKEKIVYTCLKHGDKQVFPFSLLSGHGCDGCQIKKPRKSKQQWLKEFREKHGEFYYYEDLPEIFYSTDKIEIKCSLHGTFEQTPQTHKHSGCPKCALEYRHNLTKENPTGWSYSNWEIAAQKSKRFDSFKVYVLKIWDENEVFFKIGKTFLTIQKRFDQSIRMPYTWEIFKVIRGDEAKSVSELEKKLQSDNKHNKYIPLRKFSGSNECYSNVTGI